jgi:hypothetical protein
LELLFTSLKRLYAAGRKNKGSALKFIAIAVRFKSSSSCCFLQLIPMDNIYIDDFAFLKNLFQDVDGG